MSQDGGLFADLSRVADTEAPREPRPVERLLAWRHGLLPWGALFALVGLAVGLNLALAPSPVEVLGWVLIGVGVLMLLVRPSGLGERLLRLPRWWLVLMIRLHLIAVVRSPSRDGTGWFVLIDGLLLVLGVAAARRRAASGHFAAQGKASGA